MTQIMQFPPEFGNIFDGKLKLEISDTYINKE